MDGYSVNISIIYKPDNLVGEQFTIVLGIQVRLSGLGRVKLQALSDSFTKHIEGRVSLHNFVHCLLNELLRT